MQTFKKEIELVNTSPSFSPEKAKTQLEYLKQRVLASNRQDRGWKVAITNEGNSAKLDLSCRPRRTRSQDSLDMEFFKIHKIVEDAGRGRGWVLKGTENNMFDNLSEKEIVHVEPVIPDDFGTHFSHIFGRENQISLVLSAIQAAISSDWSNRFHVALIGPPAAGKTEIAHSLKSMLGEEAVLEYDATATTQAGAIKDLAQRDVLPRILVVEEIEKAEENSLRWLLSVLDHRAEIRKVNFRSNIHRSIKMLCVATVNNHKFFNSLMSGALASRFAHHIYCPAPDHSLLAKILTREVKKMDGDVRWIKPALEYAAKKKITDPRKVLAICLCGTDRLLNGEYQKNLEACSELEVEE